MKDTVQLTITNCSECPHLDRGTCYSMDGFDVGSDWRCKKADREIAGFVEYPGDEPKRIPEWCPLREGKDT